MIPGTAATVEQENRKQLYSSFVYRWDLRRFKTDIFGQKDLLSTRAVVNSLHQTFYHHVGILMVSLTWHQEYCSKTRHVGSQRM